MCQLPHYNIVRFYNFEANFKSKSNVLIFMWYRWVLLSYFHNKFKYNKINMLLTLMFIWNLSLNAITYKQFIINSQQIFTNNILWRGWKNIDNQRVKEDWLEWNRKRIRKWEWCKYYGNFPLYKQISTQ